QEAGARRAAAGTVADSALSGTLRGGFDHADVEGPGGGGLHAALNDAAAGVRRAGAGTVADSALSGALRGGFDHAGVEDPRRRLHAALNRRAARAAVRAGTDRATGPIALGGGLPNIALPILFRAGDGGGALAAGRVRHAVEDR